MKEYPVTSRQLLSHLGGIRDYNYQRFEEEFLSAKRYASIADSLVIFKNDPLIAPPGTKYQYSSFGFVLLGCVVEGASKQTYGQYIKEAIFDVAGMASSRLDVPEDVIAHRVRGYSKTKDRTIRNSPYVDLSDRYPAGGILSTPEDLVRFAMNLLDRKLLKKETTDSMWTEQNTASGQPTKYGLGWRISSQPLEIFHGGSSVGASSYLYIQPETGIVVAFATNLDRWDEPRHKLAQDLAAIAAAMKLPED